MPPSLVALYGSSRLALPDRTARRARASPGTRARRAGTSTSTHTRSTGTSIVPVAMFYNPADSTYSRIRNGQIPALGSHTSIPSGLLFSIESTPPPFFEAYMSTPDEFVFTSEMPVTEIMQCGSDAMCAAAAWVCASTADALERAALKPNDVKGVIRYLTKHRHGSPFEHGSLTVCVDAPIFVWREWHRHRIGFAYSDYALDAALGMSFNEQSARYMKLAPKFYIPPFDRPMICTPNWKPGRPKFLTLEDAAVDDALEPHVEYDILLEEMKCGYRSEYERYARLLGNNLDPGLARDVLPVGIFSACWVTCNPRSIMSFLSLRTHDAGVAYVSYPLYEIEVVARKLEHIFASHWPETYAAFNENGRVGP